MEVTMETTLTGPIIYLLIVLGIVTAVFLALLLWRSILTTHEDDQLCIDAASEHMAQEQRELIAKITRLSKPIATSGIAAGALLLLIVGMWLYQGLKSF
jgi:predicted RND superfamily exporter protein